MKIIVLASLSSSFSKTKPIVVVLSKNWNSFALKKRWQSGTFCFPKYVRVGLGFFYIVSLYFTLYTAEIWPADLIWLFKNFQKCFLDGSAFRSLERRCCCFLSLKSDILSFICGFRVSSYSWSFFYLLGSLVKGSIVQCTIYTQKNYNNFHT